MTTSSATLRYGATLPRDHTPSGALSAGDVVILDDNRIGVAVTDIEAGRLGAVYIDGVFDITCATGTTSAIGLDAYIDISANNVVIPAASKATGDVRAGTFLAAKVSGPVVATIDLNAAAGTVSG
jgi:predicted RecA/RadA family phage recombinase